MSGFLAGISSLIKLACARLQAFWFKKNWLLMHLAHVKGKEMNRTIYSSCYGTGGGVIIMMK